MATMQNESEASLKKRKKDLADYDNWCDTFLGFLPLILQCGQALSPDISSLYL